jgi:restriction system protein
LPASPDVPARPRESLRSIPILERVRALDWFQFEKLVASLFAETGFAVERFGGAQPDGGIDLIVRFDGKTSGVQCKRWKTWKVGVKQLREFLGALTDRGLQHGIFVALQDYSADARTFAARYQIELAGEAEIVRMLESARCDENPALFSILDDTRKFCPKCESEMVLRTAAKGTDAGSRFWGCSEFPRCRSTLPVA